MPLMLLVSLGLVALLLDGDVTRLEGFLLLAGFVAFLVTTIRGGRKRGEGTPGSDRPPVGSSRAREVLGGVGLIVDGVAGLVVGARLLVDAEVGIGRML
jgi:cation:H+ antiporter